MSHRFCSVIVLGPGAPSTLKVHLSRTAIATLIFAFLLSFLAVIWVAYSFPSDIDDAHRDRLAAENQSLKTEASNASIGLTRLSARVSELEEKSKKINELMVDN
jgi:hypothetical protein